MSAAGTSNMTSNVVITGDLTVTGTATLNPDDIATTSLHLTGTLAADTSAKIGASGTPLTFVKKGTVTVDLPNVVAAANAVDVSITVTGAAVGDMVLLQPPAAALTAGLQLLQAWVSATDTVKQRVYNPTGGDINEASGTWNYCLIRS